MILVDTSVWIDFLNGAKAAEQRELQRLIEEGEDLALTGIVLTEILQGLRHDRDYERIKAYLLEFPFYEPQGIETYLRAAGIYRTCRKRGKTVRKTVDCLIAALCLENDLALLHHDRDFGRIAECVPLQIHPTRA